MFYFIHSYIHPSTNLLWQKQLNRNLTRATKRKHTTAELNQNPAAAPLGFSLVIPPRCFLVKSVPKLSVEWSRSGLMPASISCCTCHHGCCCGSISARRGPQLSHRSAGGGGTHPGPSSALTPSPIFSFTRSRPRRQAQARPDQATRSTPSY